MAPELTPRKKRTSPTDAEGSKPESETGDHRKRRRNRTTQSCLNCHTSKRMCDRKRPCGRCTQLGLTGLCVYEVDDPSQRGETHNESSHLTKRVAELEGVIRELKNKPHPRWVHSGAHDIERHRSLSISQSQSIYDAVSSVVLPTPTSTRSSSPRILYESPQDIGTCSNPSFLPSGSGPNGQTPDTHFSSSLSRHRSTHSMSGRSSSSGFSATHSPISTPSPSVMATSDSVAPDANANELPQDFPLGLDLASIFSSYSDISNHEEYALQFNPLSKHHPHHDHHNKSSGQHTSLADGHCGCLNEAGAYQILLELSLRLRKASDVLSRSSNHRMGTSCLLNQRIHELDAFANNALGNIVHPPDSFLTPTQPRYLPHDISHLPPSNSQGQLRGHGNSLAVPTTNMDPLQSWDFISSVATGESFMSWEPPRQAALTSSGASS